MERFTKIVKLLTIFEKCSILEMWQGSEYTYRFTKITFIYEIKP